MKGGKFYSVSGLRFDPVSVGDQVTSGRTDTYRSGQEDPRDYWVSGEGLGGPFPWIFLLGTECPSGSPRISTNWGDSDKGRDTLRLVLGTGPLPSVE